MFSSKRNILLVIIILAVAGVSLFGQVTQGDGYGVTVKVLPKDANITLDGQPSKSGFMRISEGEHTFTASAEGFNPDTQKVLVNRDGVVVALLPDPVSGTAYDFYQNQDNQAEREALGAIAAQTEGARIAERYPLLEKLPFPYNQMQFAIDYGKTGVDGENIVIRITGATAQSRLYALDQIREWGFDPSDYRIEFVDFLNPLGTGDL